MKEFRDTSLTGPLKGLYEGGGRHQRQQYYVIDHVCLMFKSQNPSANQLFHLFMISFDEEASYLAPTISYTSLSKIYVGNPTSQTLMVGVMSYHPISCLFLNFAVIEPFNKDSLLLDPHVLQNTSSGLQ